MCQGGFSFQPYRFSYATLLVSGGGAFYNPSNTAKEAAVSRSFRKIRGVRLQGQALQSVPSTQDWRICREIWKAFSLGLSGRFRQPAAAGLNGCPFRERVLDFGSYFRISQEH
jgi:hypothetical protein